MNATFTVFFEEPVWVGELERNDEGKSEKSRFIFESEPDDCDVYKFVLGNYEKTIPKKRAEISA